MAKFSFYFGVTAGSWLLSILVVSAELYVPFKELLKAAFGHHWIAKAVLITAAFLLSGFVFRSRKAIGDIPDERIAWYSALGSLALIALFFIAEYFR